MSTRCSAGGVPLVVLIVVTTACRSPREAPEDAAPPAVLVPTATASRPPPDVLYLPDGGDRAPPEGQRPALAPPPRAGRCPAEMVDIRGAFCIDRYEAVLEDAGGRRLSPYYHPTRTQTRATFEHWQRRWRESETAEGRAMPVTAPPAWQLAEDFVAHAVVRAGEVPHGYQSGRTADQACRAAGKRLCTEQEWVTACRGEQNTKFPYGDSYEQGRCNVFREGHPAGLLHGNPSVNHLDPRLNRVAVQGRPLLRPTGATADCRSRWGDDAVHDMVGNLDEWVDDPEGTFLGGFYSRSTREGCDQKVSAHDYSYFDYSLGIRCCQ